MIVACPLPAVALTLVGAPGTPIGVTEFDAVDDALVPAAFVAVTLNVYVVPLLKPVIVIGDEPPFAVKLPMFDVTV